MNGRSLWFFWTAFLDAHLRLTDHAIPASFWSGVVRLQPCGLLNDGVFRGRFEVNGFDTTVAVKEAIRSHVTQLPE